MRKIWISLSVLLISVILFCIINCGASGEVELTKEEALLLMNLQTQAVLAIADRDEHIKFLYTKYALDPKTHSLDVATGKFVPREIENVQPAP